MSHSTTSISGTGSAVAGNKIQVLTPERSEEVFSGIKWLDNLVGEIEFNRYGIYAIALLLIGILGGIPVGLGAMTSSLSIAILIIPTMASLTMILAVAPMRLLLWTVLVTCIIDFIMIIAMVVAWGEPLSTLF